MSHLTPEYPETLHGIEMQFYADAHAPASARIGRPARLVNAIENAKTRPIGRTDDVTPEWLAGEFNKQVPQSEYDAYPDRQDGMG